MNHNRDSKNVIEYDLKSIKATARKRKATLKCYLNMYHLVNTFEDT